MKTKKIILILSIIILSCHGSKDKPNAENKITTVFNSDLAMPDFMISTIKDSSDFKSADIQKDGIILLKYFSPDCENCQEEAELYFSKKDSLKNVRTIWISGEWAELSMIREFAENYKLKELNPIVIGKETDRFLISHYDFSGIPFAAVYKDNQLIKTYTGSLDFGELITINDGKFIPEPLDLEKQKEKSPSPKN